MYFLHDMIPERADMRPKSQRDVSMFLVIGLMKKRAITENYDLKVN